MSKAAVKDDGLVVRLREEALKERASFPYTGPIVDFVEEAADRIEELEQEIHDAKLRERALKAEIDGLAERFKRMGKELKKLCA